MSTLPRNHQYHFRVNKETLDDVKKIAKENGTTVSDLLNTFLEGVKQTKRIDLPQNPSRTITREELVSDMDNIFQEYDLVFRELVNK